MKKTLYILQDGELHRKDNSLYFESNRARKFIPVENTSDICIFGDVRVSKRFLDFCTKKQVCIHYFDIKGNYVGTYYPREYYNSGHVIIKQVQHYLDEGKRIILAKSVASAFAEQNLKVIRYYTLRTKGKNKERLKNLENKLKELKDLINDVTLSNLIPLVEEIENIYNQVLIYIISNKEYIDANNEESIAYKRKTNLIRLGESVGQAIILSEIYKTHLDPRIGYIYDIDSKKFPLVLDMLCIFKAIIVYRPVLTLINKSIISKDDFEKYNNDIILSQKGKGKFIKEIDKRMRTTIKHRNLGRSVSYRRLIRLELYKIQKHIVEEKKYVPYQMLW